MNEPINIKINQSCAILIDGNNIELSLQSLTGKKNALVDFDMLIPKLLDKRGLNRLIYFREGISISSKLANRLLDKFHGSVMPCHKSADIPLTIKATQIANKVDTIIILSGDSDYVELVRHLRGEGVRVEIAAVKKTTAQILINEADHFTEITEEDCYILKAARKSRPTSSTKSSSSSSKSSSTKSSSTDNKADNGSSKSTKSSSSKSAGSKSSKSGSTKSTTTKSTRSSRSSRSSNKSKSSNSKSTQSKPTDSQSSGSNKSSSRSSRSRKSSGTKSAASQSKSNGGAKQSNTRTSKSSSSNKSSGKSRRGRRKTNTNEDKK